MFVEYVTQVNKKKRTIISKYTQHYKIPTFRQTFYRYGLGHNKMYVFVLHTK